MKDNQILRELARKYFEIAMSEENLSKIKLHKSVNDLKMIRPAVFIDELPWAQMNINNELTLACKDPFCRGIENFFRMWLYKHKHFKADMYFKPYFPVSKQVDHGDIGLRIVEEILQKSDATHIVSHEYHDILSTDEDLEKIKKPIVSYNEKRTMEAFEKVGEIIGDILPVRLKGIEWFNVTTWDDISRYRGVNNLLMDLIERPEFTHEMVEKLTETKIALLEQYEKLGLLDDDINNLHCTAGMTDDMPKANEIVTRDNVWGRGAAQIFASVSKTMHEEFDIEYMNKTIGTCGMVYYGCCEPLDKKIDIVEKIHNLRKISITPWADVNIAAEAIGKKYVVALKPNPASVATSNLDEDALRKEIKQMLDACQKNNCSCDIVLKDISTCCNNPENIFRWEKIVMEMVESY